MTCYTSPLSGEMFTYTLYITFSITIISVTFVIHEKYCVFDVFYAFNVLDVLDVIDAKDVIYA